MACPLSLNRICLSLFATIEAIQLPVRLVESGLSSAQALSLYGVFSGMAFPTVMFPCAITGSAATLLLPSIAEAQSQGNKKRIRQTTILTIVLCLLMGFGCMCFFLLFAEPLPKCRICQPTAFPGFCMSFPVSVRYVKQHSSWAW